MRIQPVTGFGFLMLLVCACSALPAADLQKTLELPFIESVVGDATSQKLVWVQQERGIRRIQSIDLVKAGALPTTLVEYPDDGLPIHGLTLSENGQYLSYVRGQAPHRGNTLANPLNRLEPDSPGVWLLAIQKPEPIRLSEGHDPAFSPDATLIAWLHRGQLFVRAVADPAPGKSTKPAFRQAGRIIEFQWSPDGKRIAYSLDRGNHRWIGLYDLKPRGLRFIDPGVDRDQLPRFSPDGRKLAFIRIPGLRRDERPNMTVGVPFSIRLAQLDNAQAQELWRSPGADGGYAQWGVDPGLGFIDDQRLVFASEHEHWVRLYELDAQRREAKPLTPPFCETTQWRHRPASNELLFTSNCFDAEGRQIARLDLKNGRLSRLDAGDRIATDPIAMADRVAFRVSGPQRPSTVGLLALGQGATVRYLTPVQVPSGVRLVVPKTIILQAADGIGVSAQVFEPPGERMEGKKPALVYVHGGPVRQMLPGFHYKTYYHRIYAVLQYLAQEGYVVISVNFRSGAGYGRTFRLWPQQGPRGASEYQDVLAAAEYLRHRHDVDARRIGIWGGSYGGFLAAWALAHDSEMFAAGVDWHGVHDWVASARSERGTDWGIVPDEYELAARFSPNRATDGWSSPVLLVHGDADSRVDMAETVDLAQRLRQKGTRVSVLVLPNEEHDFLLYRNWVNASQASAVFLDQWLRAAPTP